MATDIGQKAEVSSVARSSLRDLLLVLIVQIVIAALVSVAVVSFLDRGEPVAPSEPARPWIAIDFQKGS